MSTHTPFQPKRGASKKVTATTTSSVVAFGAGQKSLRILNAGAVVAYFRTFDSSDSVDAAIACTSADTPVGPASSMSSCLVIEKPINHDSAAILGDGASSVMYLQPGEGGY